MQIMHTLEDAIKRYDYEINPSAPILSMCDRLRQKFGSIALDKLTPVMIANYMRQRLDAGAAIASINLELAVLSKIYSLSIRDWGWTTSNPVSGVSRLKGATKRERWLTDDEEESLLAASPEWLQHIIVLALQTGMRRGELLRLTWGCIMPDNYILVDKSKNGDRRGIPISTLAAEVLAVLSNRTRARLVFPEIQAQKKPDARGQVLLGPGGAEISKNALEYAFRQACSKAGLAGLHFHDLRHTFATRLVQRGTELYAVQRLLGHRNPLMTMRYAHHSVESLRRAIQVLDQ